MASLPPKVALCDLVTNYNVLVAVQSIFVRFSRELHWFRRSLRGYLAIKLIRWNIRARKKIREKALPTKAGENVLRAMEE